MITISGRCVSPIMTYLSIWLKLPAHQLILYTRSIINLVRRSIQVKEMAIKIINIPFKLLTKRISPKCRKILAHFRKKHCRLPSSILKTCIQKQRFTTTQNLTREARKYESNFTRQNISNGCPSSTIENSYTCLGPSNLHIELKGRPRSYIY